jgi:hypothetical protein
MKDKEIQEEVAAMCSEIKHEVKIFTCENCFKEYSEEEHGKDGICVYCLSC